MSSKNNTFANNIVNLSSHVLTTHEISVLGKGLSFIPKPKHVDTDDILEGIAKLKSQMASKTNKKEKLTLATTVEHSYNPWQTIRTFITTNNNNKATEVQKQYLRNFFTNTTAGVERILPCLKQNQRTT